MPTNAVGHDSLSPSLLKVGSLNRSPRWTAPLCPNDAKNTHGIAVDGAVRPLFLPENPAKKTIKDVKTAVPSVRSSRKRANFSARSRDWIRIFVAANICPSHILEENWCPMRSSTQLTLCFLVAVCLIGFVGCQDSGKTVVAKSDANTSQHDDPDADGDHKHAENYDDAVAELVEMQTKIKDNIGNGNTEAAEGPLHDVVHVLEIIGNFVQNSDLDDEAKKSCTDAIENLYGSFNAIDDKLHGDEGKDYDEVSEQIETSIKTLQEQVTKIAKE